jgi:hypothetical protein
METVLIIFGVLIFTYFAIVSGYKLAIVRWQPKDMVDKLEKYAEVNKELVDTIKKYDEINTQKDTWYLTQLNNLGQYMKEKHNDNYVFDQLKLLSGYQLPENKESVILELDTILDKASKYGFNSLSEEEMNYLKNTRNNEK